MQYHKLNRLIIPAISAIFAIGIPATAATTSSDQAAKLTAIKSLYQQDINDQGSQSSVLIKFAAPDLKGALQREQDYFDKNQQICGVDYDVIWDSQDPEFVMPKISADNDRIKATLGHGTDIYYQLDCQGDSCQITDVTLTGGGSLKSTLNSSCTL